MTRWWIRFTIASFVGELEQVRLLGGNGSPVQLEDRFSPTLLLLLSIREARRPVVLSGGIDFSGL
jgi:hypothetical protein